MEMELDGDGASILSMPLYPLSRTDTADSRRGLLSRTGSVSTIDTQRYLTRTPTNPYALTRTDTNVSDSRSHHRADSNVSSASLPQRQPTIPHLAGDFGISRASPSIDTRVPTRPGPLSARSAPGFGPSSTGPSPMSTRSDQGYGPPARSNTTRVEQGLGPPPRSNTFGGVGVTPRRPDRPFDLNGRGNTFRGDRQYY